MIAGIGIVGNNPRVINPAYFFVTDTIVQRERNGKATSTSRRSTRVVFLARRRRHRTEQTWLPDSERECELPDAPNPILRASVASIRASAFGR